MDLPLCATFTEVASNDNPHSPTEVHVFLYLPPSLLQSLATETHKLGGVASPVAIAVAPEEEQSSPRASLIGPRNEPCTDTKDISRPLTLETFSKQRLLASSSETPNCSARS
jgi:hypothetical protein